MRVPQSYNHVTVIYFHSICAEAFLQKVEALLNAWWNVPYFSICNGIPANFVFPQKTTWNSANNHLSWSEPEPERCQRDLYNNVCSIDSIFRLK
jgi:hypothetical protein